MHAPITAQKPATERPIVVLGDEASTEVMRFLARDPVSNVFMLSWLENYGICAPGRPELFAFHAARRDDQLVGVSLLITQRLALLSADDASIAASLGRYYRERGFKLDHVVSERQVVTPFWQHYQELMKVRARLVRDQELYGIERNDWVRLRRNESAGGVRLAQRRDLDAVFLASARMHAEETLEDPLTRDARHFRRHVEHRIENGRTYVWFDDHRRLLFKADISAQSGWGAQISGVYTPHSLRGQGIATAAMTSICDALFERGFPRTTLYVNRTNYAARRVYQKVGFRYHTDYQTVFVESGHS